MEKFAKFYVWWLENMPIYCVLLALLIALVIFCKEILDETFSRSDLPIYVFAPISVGVILGIFAPFLLPPILIYYFAYLIIKLIKKKKSK